MVTSEEDSCEIIIDWSNQHNSSVVDIPELPGCMPDGIPVEEAVKNAKEIVTEWIQTATHEGREILKLRGRLVFATEFSEGID
ncbi:MAG TPA: type II toxin-antitoxin system HicB family antitoxin [Candidatus Hodarchaeales archaeon]|nr:type II toxin-antitoxin system HicB family antitoxin [Candidatus Hodarchaeales archaeon]